MSFSFGTPSSAPASSSLSAGFSFGANKPATPGFGLTATSQPSTGLFGATPTTSAPAFGTAATPAFGAASTPAFGATATPAFGSTTTPAFGAATPAFGATTTPAFGATTAPAFGATTTPAFGATTTPAFGATTTPAFGSTGLGTGGLNFGTGTNTSTPATGLSFGASTTSSTGLGGFGFGNATATTQPSLGLFGAPSTATTSTGLFGGRLGITTVTGSLPSTSVTSSIGLGGVATTAPGIGAANTTATSNGKSEPPKQQKLPNEISTTVESFKEFVKKQKGISSEIMRASVKLLYKVSQDAEELLRSILFLSGEVSKARAQSKRLRSAGANALAAAEVAGRDAPYAEYEGSAPPGYIKELITDLEQQLITFKRQMDVADKQMQSSPKLLSEQELTLGIRRMHESLVALAGRLQAVHSQVEAQKEQYLNLRKYILKDSTNVFENQSTGSSLDQILRDVEGSRKKSKLNYSDTLGSAVLSDPKTVLGNMQQLAGPTPFTYLGTSLGTPYQTVETPGTTWQPQQTSLNSSFNTSGFGMFGAADSGTAFQLQKPPGKRTKQ